MDTGLLPIDIVASGILPSHPQNYLVHWQIGCREYGFVYFQCPVILRDIAGCYERPSGTCILYEPYAPRYYRAAEGFLRHTWFLALGPGIPQCLERYELPIETAMTFGETPFIETFVKDVRQERLQLNTYWQDAITDLCHEFFRHMGALRLERVQASTPAQLRLTALLKETRMEVHSDLARQWTVAEMAAIADLHPTRFAMDYSKLFGISPINDLIDARLRHAQALLARFPYQIKRVASECGFASVEHFVRTFHKRIGISPGQVRDLQ